MSIDLKKIKKLIEKASAVSFDIYDTMITRCIGNSYNVFYYLEDVLIEKYGNQYNNFALKRIESEVRARRYSLQEEVTIMEIYQYLNIEDRYSILDIEKKIELDFSEPNLDIKEIYDLCISLNKKIIFCSDMYLDAKTMQKILKKCGYGQYNELLLSSDLRHTKKTGNIFADLILKSGCSPKNIIHIGDNIRSDYYNAKKYGIKAYLYKRNQLYLKGSTKYNAAHVLYGNMPNSFSNKYYWEQIGKYSLGNFLFGFSKWLISELEDNNYDHIFFLSRDGWIMLEAIKELGSDSLISKCKYLYASRRSLIVPTLFMYDGFEARIKAMFWKKHFTIKDFVENFGLEYEKCKSIISCITTDYNYMYERAEMLNNEVLKKVYKLLEDSITDNSIKEHKLIIKYLKQEKFEGNVAIVDTGWFGNLQNAIIHNIRKSDIDAKVTGYYIGIRDKCKYFNSQKMKAFLYCGMEQHDNQRLESKATAIIEAFFSHNEGSTKCYEDIGSRITPVLKKLESTTNQKRILDVIQNEAINRIRFLDRITLLDEVVISPLTYFIGICRIALYPNLNDAWKIGIYIETKELKNTLYYMIHPWVVKKDVYELAWKLGQLKRILKLPIDYVRFYEFVDR